MASSSAIACGSSKSSITAATVTGSHVLRIRSYFNTLGYRIGSCLTSPKFLAAGHVWSISFYPHGYDEETSDCISFYLNMDGRHSVRAVRAQFSISLLDPTGNPKYRRATVVPVAFKEASKQCWGFPRFITREDLEKSIFLQDNCFSILCDITVINGFHRHAADGDSVVPVPASDLNQDLGQLLATGKLADVKFKVGDRLFLAHKNVLAARSSVFMAELFGPLKDEATDCLQIHDMEPEVFSAMLTFIYTDSLPEIHTGEIEMTQHLLVAADRYDVKRLKLICENKLSCRITKKTAALTLVLAEQHGCHGLKKACFAFLLSLGNLKVAMDTDGYDHLRSSCPSLHYELVAKFGVSKRNKNKSFWCFSA